MYVPTESEIAQLIPDIASVTQLKHGGQKAAFRAVHRGLGDVVVKILLDTRADDRMKREIEIAMDGGFPRVPQIYTWGKFTLNGADSLYVVEQYINGGDLRIALSAGPLPPDRVIVMIADLLETIVAMEARGVVHRDIKPENIVVCDDGHFWLLDFGIARDLRRTSLTATGAHFGPHTAGYSAPEQFRNMKKRIDSKCDLFSLGVVAYECIAGKHPFASEARDYLDVLRRTETLVVAPLIVRGEMTAALAQFIHVLMEQYPSRRPPSAGFAKQWFSEIAGKQR